MHTIKSEGQCLKLFESFGGDVFDVLSIAIGKLSKFGTARTAQAKA